METPWTIEENVLPQHAHWMPFGGVDRARWQALTQVFLEASWPVLTPSELEGCQFDEAATASIGHWRSAGYGRMAVCKALGDGPHTLSCFIPAEHTAIIHRFRACAFAMSPDGLHRRIEGELLAPGEASENGASAAFYCHDPLWVTAVLEPGDECDVSLSLIALTCGEAHCHREEIATPAGLRELLTDNDDPDLTAMLLAPTVTVDTSQLCAFLPHSAPSGRPDEATFRGKITSARKLRRPIANSFGWTLMVTVLSLQEDICVPILVTENVWQSEHPPRRGQYVEGIAWVQGNIRKLPERLSHASSNIDVRPAD